MGLLGDVYSYGDTLKRKVGGLLSDPRGTLEQFVGQLGDDMNTNISNMKTGYGFGGNKSVLSDPAQVQAAQRALADYGAQSGMAAATVWHGSPHKFDKFDSSKIGTGEGAQAYGHGLYLAESPDVAQGYKTTLSPYELVKNGKQIPYEQMDAVTAGVASDIASKKGDLKAVRSMYENMANQKFGGAVAKQRLAALDSMGANVGAEKGGSLYKVDLPDEAIAKMLDWDKPLSQQHHVMELINKQEAARTQSVLDQRMQTLANVGENAPNASVLKRQIDLLREEVAKPQESGLGAMTGGEYYNYLRRRDVAPTVQADMFKQAGIPGIRYLDGGSRGAGAGSSNFVIFPGNEGLLQILERNGQALK